MKPAYTIIIIGTGQHHQGHSTGNPERDADNHLKGVVDRLQATGQNITAAAFIVDGKPEMIVGHPEDLRTVVPPEDVTGVTLETVNANVLKVLAQLGEKKEAAPRAAKAEKKGGAATKVLPEPPQNAGLDTDGKPAVLGTVPMPVAGQTKDAAPPNEPPAVREVDGDGICTRCGAMFEGEVEAEDHLNEPMCEAKEGAEG